MNYNRPITDSLAGTKPVLSVEFFPPKDEQGGKKILETAAQLKEQIHPQFVSITYGAGGTTRERTFNYAKILKEDYEFQVMPHLTCVGSSKSELFDIVKSYQESGFCNIMALRGDPPKGESNFVPHPDGLKYASDLVAFIRHNFSGFCLGVAGYPEKHPEAESLESDLQHLKQKVDAGASFITTQLFYDNAYFFRFVEQCRAIDINVPIVPGILPVVSLAQVQRFCQMCETAIPKELEQSLQAAGDDPEKSRKVGIEWAYTQIAELIEKGAPGVHLYILNRKESAIELVSKLTSNGVI